MLDRAASMAATEVMIEIRSGVHPRELVLPADVDVRLRFTTMRSITRTASAAAAAMLLVLGMVVVRWYLLCLEHK